MSERMQSRTARSRILPNLPVLLAGAALCVAPIGPKAGAEETGMLPGILPENVNVTGSIGGEARVFFFDPRFAGQLDGVQPSVFGEATIDWQDEARENQLVFTAFGRLDARDERRTHADVREAYWRHDGGEYELLLGVNRVFWGVTESRHLVNVINQIDAVENIDGEDYLGQPMVHVATQQDFGRFGVYVMPGFREQTFAGREGRLRGPIAVDDDSASYQSSLGRLHPDLALRYSHFIGDFDIGAHAFYGHSREPNLVPFVGSGGLALRPHYELITQAGVDLQYTREAWLWKLEALVRDGHGDPFVAAVGGFEYTEYQIFETDADLGLLAEYLVDGRSERDAPSTTFQNDIFLGARLALNDVEDTSILAGGLYDLEHGSTSFRVEAETRIGESWRAEIEGQFFTHAAKDDPGAVFENDSFLTLRMTRFF